MIVNETALRVIMPRGFAKIPEFLAPINATLEKWKIDTPQRAAMFLAHAAHESAELLYTTEIASGAAYEGRGDLGNTQPGDGIRFKGRGIFQLTGRLAYLRCGNALNVDLIANPTLLAAPGLATDSAGWFWSDRRLNELADGDRIGACTRAINGGFNGLDQRIAYWLRARRVFGL